MKKLGFVTLFIVLTFCVPAVSLAQKTSEIAAIDAYCKSVDAIQKRHKLPDLVFADVANYEKDEKEKWRLFSSIKALDKFREKTETYTTAYNWQKYGKIVATNFTLSSPSGDWAKYVFSYYRTDGTLAKVKVDYRTFMGDMIVLQDTYFDRGGKILKKTNRFEDLTTRKPKKVEKDSFDSSILNEVDYYTTTKKLPFVLLLKGM